MKSKHGPRAPAATPWYARRAGGHKALLLHPFVQAAERGTKAKRRAAARTRMLERGSHTLLLLPYPTQYVRSIRRGFKQARPHPAAEACPF